MKKHPGFTLLETMFIVAIIGLLAAIAIPVMTHVKVRSQATTAANHLQKISDEFNIILFEQGTIPDGTYNENNSKSVPDGFDANDVKVVMMQPLGSSIVFSFDYEAQGEGRAIMKRVGAPFDQDMLLAIDKILDDGDISTGLGRKQSDGEYYLVSYNAH